MMRAVGAFLRSTGWRAVLAATGGLDVGGAPPDGPCVVVANHASHADTAVLLAALPARRRPVVAAAADYWFGRPVRAWAARLLAAAFPVRRDGGGCADLLAAETHLRAGRIVVVYPEGTRSGGDRVGRFRSGAARLAERASVPLVPVVIDGTRRVLPKNGRLRRGRVTVRFGAPVYDIDLARERVAEMLAGASR